MLQLTAKAVEWMQVALAESEREENACIRIVVTEEGSHLAIDEQHEDDVTVSHEDKVLVVLDPATAGLLEDRKIDYDEEASRFFFV